MSQCRERGSRRHCTYACAPSLSAMNGRFPQSFSIAGSVPSSTPSHVSISGPLYTMLAACDFSFAPVSPIPLLVPSTWHLPRMMEVHDTHNGCEPRHFRSCLHFLGVFLCTIVMSESRTEGWPWSAREVGLDGGESRCGRSACLVLILSRECCARRAALGAA